MTTEFFITNVSILNGAKFSLEVDAVITNKQILLDLNRIHDQPIIYNKSGDLYVFNFRCHSLETLIDSFALTFARAGVVDHRRCPSFYRDMRWQSDYWAKGSRLATHWDQILVKFPVIALNGGTDWCQSLVLSQSGVLFSTHADDCLTLPEVLAQIAAAERSDHTDDDHYDKQREFVLSTLKDES